MISPQMKGKNGRVVASDRLLKKSLELVDKVI